MPATKRTETAPKPSARRAWIIAGITILVIAGATAGGLYWYINSKEVYIDTAQIQAPVIDLAPAAAGILENVYVNEGDTVPAHTIVARVGDQLIQTKVAGIIVSVPQIIGATISPGQAVVTMVDPTQLRVVGSIDENKGLSRIQVGDPVTFTVDAFGSQQFSGVVTTIAPSAKQAGIVFNISNTRQTQQFDVKARFDTTKYPQLKNGMSARMWVYTP